MSAGKEKTLGEILSRYPYYEVEYLYKQWKGKKTSTVSKFDVILALLLFENGDAFSLGGGFLLFLIPEILNYMAALNKTETLFLAGLIRMTMGVIITTFMLAHRVTSIYILIAFYLFYTAFRSLSRYRGMRENYLSLKSEISPDKDLEKAFVDMKREGVFADGSRIIFKKGRRTWYGCFGKERVFFILPGAAELVSFSREIFYMRILDAQQKESRYKVLMQMGDQTLEGWIDQVVYERYCDWKECGGPDIAVPLYQRIRPS